MSQDNTRSGKRTYTSNAAFAAHLCLVAYGGAGKVDVPSSADQIPLFVSGSAATAAGETTECVPINSEKEMRIRCNGAVTALDLLEPIMSGANAGKVQVVDSGRPMFQALETAADEGLVLVQPLPMAGLEGLEVQDDPGTLNATGTLTAALLGGGIVTSSTAAAVTATLVTGELMDDGHPNVPINGTLEVLFINTGGANAFTVTAATGFTIVGNGAVAASSSKKATLRRTAADTWVCYM